MGKFESLVNARAWQTHTSHNTAAWIFRRKSLTEEFLSAIHPTEWAIPIAFPQRDGESKTGTSSFVSWPGMGPYSGPWMEK